VAAAERVVSSAFILTRRDMSSGPQGPRCVSHLGKRRVQTIKLPISGQTGLQTLREIESDVRSDVPDLMQISDEDVKTWFQAQGVAGALAPVFTTELKRTVWSAVLHESEIEVALDLGEVRAGERRLPISEIELELKSGSPGRLVEMALLLHRGYPLPGNTIPGRPVATS
jgi:inorganic triphosphatase YgiF